MSTFLPETYVELIARKLTADDASRLSAGSLRELSAVHRERGELLSAWQYTEMAERKEVEGGKREGSSSLRAV